MKTFEVTYVEQLFHIFYVDAENEKDAIDEFHRQGLDGELDFSDGTIDDTWIESVQEVGK